jgi:hypothetical protein
MTVVMGQGRFDRRPSVTAVERAGAVERDDIGITAMFAAISPHRAFFLDIFPIPLYGGPHSTRGDWDVSGDIRCVPPGGRVI